MFRKHAGRAGRGLALVCAGALLVSCAQRPGAGVQTPALVDSQDPELQRFGASIRGVSRISAENASRSRSERAALVESDPGKAGLVDFVESHPDDLASRQELASAYLEQGLFWNAYELFEELETLQPGRSGVSLGLASIWHAWGEYDLALASAQRAASDWPSPMAYTLLGRIRLDRGESRHAVEAFLRANELRPNDTEVLARTGMAFMSLAEWREAHTFLERALALEPDMKDVRMQLAIVLVALDDHGGALAELLEVSPPPLAWNSLGTFYLRRNETEKAYEAFAQAVALEPAYELAKRNMALAASRLRRAR